MGMKNTAVFAMCLMLALFISFDTASAQEADKKSTKVIEVTEGGETVRIEIEDGTIRVNGEEVPEGADITDYLPEGLDSDVLFMGDDVRVFGPEHGNRVVFKRKGPGDGPGGNATMWFSRDGENEFARKFAPMKEMEFDLGRIPDAPHMGDYFVRHMSEFMNPEIGKKEREAYALARELRSVDETDRATVEKQLDDLLVEIFEMKLEMRQEHLEEAREKLAHEEAEIRERRARKQEIIERRKNELTGSGDHLEW